MSRRAPPPITLRGYQQEAADQLAGAALETLRLIQRAPAERRRIARRIGCSLLEAPTGSGKTIVLGATAEAVSQGAPVAWFWFAPFAGLIAQTGAALRAGAPGPRVRDPVRDRADTGTRSGDVFIATWAAVPACNADTRRMRVDDDTAAALDTGWVFLGDPAGQEGLQKAADRIKAIRDSIQVSTDGVAVYEAAVGEGGLLTLTDERGQSMLLLEPPPDPTGDDETAPSSAIGAQPFRVTGSLFGQLLELQSPAPAPAEEVAPPPGSVPRPRLPYQYPQRTGLPVPRCLRGERMPRETDGLLDALVRDVSFDAQHLAAARRSRADVERREADLFDPTRQHREQEQATISDLFARANAYQLLRVSQHLDPAELGRLQASLAEAQRDAGEDVIPERELRRALNVVLLQFPTLLKDALRRAMGSRADMVDAADLPVEWGSALPLSPSPRDLHGVMLGGLNTWEQPFADWLDKQPRVLWGTRDLSRPTAADDWSVRIVLPETGRGYYPDFVVCVEGRVKLDGIALAETKERMETEQAAAKSRSEHREYGRALMLSHDISSDRFIRVEYAPDLGRNREIGPLRPDDMVAG